MVKQLAFEQKFDHPQRQPFISARNLERRKQQGARLEVARDEEPLKGVEVVFDAVTETIECFAETVVKVVDGGFLERLNFGL